MSPRRSSFHPSARRVSAASRSTGVVAISPCCAWSMAELHRGRPCPEDEWPWLPFTIREIPVWVRDREVEPGPLGAGLLASIVDGDVLATVSRRDPRRGRIDVWTSLNRVYATSHPAAVQAICRAL